VEEEELTPEQRAALERARLRSASGEASHEEILREFGLKKDRTLRPSASGPLVPEARADLRAIDREPAIQILIAWTATSPVVPVM